MTDSILVWPAAVLSPLQSAVNQVAFSRSGPRSLGGIERSTTTDRGYWAVDFKGVPLSSPEQRRLWNVLRTDLGGRAGLIAVPAWSFDSAPWLAGTVLGRFQSSHSDDSLFDDGASYEQPGILVELVSAAAVGDTSLTLRRVYGIDDLTGVRFSYEHALYETGKASLIDGDEWTVDIFPDVRAAIPAGAQLEFDLPTVLVHLATDREMDVDLSRGQVDRADVSFLEAVDYWNSLAG